MRLAGLQDELDLSSVQYQVRGAAIEWIEALHRANKKEDYRLDSLRRLYPDADSVKSIP